MSISTEKTDEQVGAILEAIREQAPEVAEQAVTYYQIADMIGLAVVGGIALVATIIAVVSFVRWRMDDCRITDDLACPIIAGLIGCVFWLGCLIPGLDLVKINHAPDYYAAECMVDMAKQLK